MLDTMTLTKAGAALCGALLVFLLVNWAAETVYFGGGSSHGEGAEQGYTVAMAEPAAEEAPAEDTGSALAELLSAADAAAGEKVLGKCKACHKMDGTNGVGPYLNGVVGRDIGSVAGYTFSAALTELPDTWTPEALDAFLANPKGYAAGTKMSFAGLPKPADRANLIAYLQGLGG